MTSKTKTDRWWEFGGSNLQAVYGYGTDAEAERYCDYLNHRRAIDLYGAYEADAETAARLDSGDRDDGVDMADALCELDQAGRWPVPSDTE